jgi:hypothetical protein
VAFDYQRSVAMLLRWLPRMTNPWVKEAIISTPPEQWNLKWALGNALDAVADQSFVEELLELVRDPSHGAPGT